ncbi:MAG TPA: carbon-nitrogen hydrolase family protein [Candidatus Saccharimonadales bacterium]|nr:carbon-nitrogen hydrolase family protein [Candidatus Saccharimonadales bacterium]
MAQKEVGGLFRIAIAQLPISGDVKANSAKVKQAMHDAAESGARLIQFPEGMLTGYAKHPIMDWSEVDWPLVGKELKSIMVLAGKLNLWVVLGSAHKLTPPHWPHNSLYVISDEGKLVNRYDKRIVSHTEVTKFYAAGAEPVIFDVDGYRFGCTLCIEVHFPELFAEYNQLGVDCVLFSAFADSKIFYTEAQAHAAMQCCWVSLSIPSDTSGKLQSGLIGPDGEAVNTIDKKEGIVFAELDRDAPQFDTPLNKAKPWRASVARDPSYNTRALNDPRSVDRTNI